MQIHIQGRAAGRVKAERGGEGERERVRGEATQRVATRRTHQSTTMSQARMKHETGYSWVGKKKLQA